MVKLNLSQKKILHFGMESDSVEFLVNQSESDASFFYTQLYKSEIITHLYTQSLWSNVAAPLEAAADQY